MQESKTNSGTLYICGTPIGNLEDMTFRAIRILKEVDLIAAEDTRNSIKLLNHFEIKTPMTSYHEHNKLEKGRALVEKMLGGTNIALISDAGMPTISDPGEELVRLCIEAGILVTSIPGATAFVTALSLSGLPARRFVFEAFLETDNKRRRKRLEELSQEERTIILYEAPHRLKKTLKDLFEALGNRRISICKELTKKYEKSMDTTLEDASTYFKEETLKGEHVLVIEGKSRDEKRAQEVEKWLSLSIEEHIKVYEDEVGRKAAMKKVAEDRGVTKRDIYQALLQSPTTKE